MEETEFAGGDGESGSEVASESGIGPIGDPKAWLELVEAKKIEPSEVKRRRERGRWGEEGRDARGKWPNKASKQ